MRPRRRHGTRRVPACARGNVTRRLRRRRVRGLQGRHLRRRARHLRLRQWRRLRLPRRRRRHRVAPRRQGRHQRHLLQLEGQLEPGGQQELDKIEKLQTQELEMLHVADAPAWCSTKCPSGTVGCEVLLTTRCLASNCAGITAVLGNVFCASTLPSLHARAVLTCKGGPGKVLVCGGGNDDLLYNPAELEFNETRKPGDLSTLCNFKSIDVHVVLEKCYGEALVPSLLLLLDCGEWQPCPPPMQVEIKCCKADVHTAQWLSFIMVRGGSGNIDLVWLWKTPWPFLLQQHIRYARNIIYFSAVDIAGYHGDVILKQPWPLLYKLNIRSVERCNHLLRELSARVPAVQLFCRFPVLQHKCGGHHFRLHLLEKCQLDIIGEVCDHQVPASTNSSLNIRTAEVGEASGQAGYAPAPFHPYGLIIGTGNTYAVVKNSFKATCSPYEIFKARYAQMECAILSTEMAGIDICGAVSRGVSVPALDKEVQWASQPNKLAIGDDITGGNLDATVFENILMQHHVALPPGAMGKESYIALAGQYSLQDTMLRSTGQTGIFPLEGAMEYLHSLSRAQPACFLDGAGFCSTRRSFNTQASTSNATDLEGLTKDTTTEASVQSEHHVLGPAEDYEKCGVSILSEDFIQGYHSAGNPNRENNDKLVSMGISLSEECSLFQSSEGLVKFNAHVDGTYLDHNLVVLQSHVASAFQFSSDVEFILTYTYENGDRVMLDDGNDLRDAGIKQKFTFNVAANLLGVCIHAQFNLREHQSWYIGASCAEESHVCLTMARATKDSAGRNNSVTSLL